MDSVQLTGERIYTLSPFEKNKILPRLGVHGMYVYSYHPGGGEMRAINMR